MKVPQSLPQIWTGRDLAQATGRSPLNVTEMSSRGLLAAPTHSYRGKPAWLRTSALNWFTMLHDHAVVVPANDLAFSELQTYGIYMCPMSKDHVTLARPELLVMYEPGGSGRVFRVTEVETVHQILQGTRPTSPSTSQIVRDGTAIGTPSSGGWTVFYLDPEAAGDIDSITPVVQQGRYVPITDVRNAMSSRTLVAHKLDVAFPMQW
jgi:hypothetical protein